MESTQPDPYRYQLSSRQRAASSFFIPELHCTGWCRVDVQLAFRECAIILDEPTRIVQRTEPQAG